MSNCRFAPILLFLFTCSAYAVDHTGSAPAAHMEIKDEFGTIVCFAYSTPPESAPFTTSCPEGLYTEQLFDESWEQISQTTVTISSTPPDLARVPVRIERTCEWNESDIIDVFRGADAGDNFDPYCEITCGVGVAIDGEADGTIPGLIGTDDATLDSLYHTDGTGTDTIRIFVRSGIPAAVLFERFTLNGEPADFTGLIYQIDAAAVCL